MKQIRLPIMSIFIGVTLFALTNLQSGQTQPNITSNPTRQTAKDRGCREGNFSLNTINPEWVSVEPGDPHRLVEGTVRESRVATLDNPAFHTSHDWRADVILDSAYSGYLGEGNEQGLMEMEWETAFFPPAYWPSPGDHGIFYGSWIFDCGHPDEGYRTEIHPPDLVASTRIEPMIFPNESSPSTSFVTRIFLTGHGGYKQTQIAGNGRDYFVDVPLPPRPVISILEIQTLQSWLVSSEGSVKPTMTLLPNTNPPKMRIKYELANVSDPQNTIRLGAVIATRWNSDSGIDEPPMRKLRVSINKIMINNSRDSGAGEFRMWIRVDRKWFRVSLPEQLSGGTEVPINQTFDVYVRNDAFLSVQTTGWEDDCDGEFRRSESEIKLWDFKLSDRQCRDMALSNPNDYIGIVDNTYTLSNNFGIGTHEESSKQNSDEPGTESAGDFTLSYDIQEVGSFPASTRRAPTPVGNSVHR
jgi:hypothetical protein